jgi:uncharacterized delta-60 repeat protein
MAAIPVPRSLPHIAGALLAIATCSALLSACDSSDAAGPDPLSHAPFAARHLLALGPNRVLVLGTTDDPGDETCAKLAALWVDAKGRIERAVRIPHDDCIASLFDAAYKAGKITLSTTIFHPNTSQFEDNSSQTPDLIRLQPDGSLDSAFAGGIVQTSASAFGLFSDGSLVAQDGRHYLNDGKVDLHFAGGKQIAPGIDSTFAGAIAVRPDDSFTVMSLQRQTQEGVILQRFTPQGLLDRSFGKRGMTVTDIDPRHKGSFETDLGPLLPTPDGSLLAFGVYTPGTAVNSRYVLLKFNRAGKLDPRFGRRGRLVLLPRPYAGHHLSVGQVTLQRNGDAVAVARAGGGHQLTLLLRYRPDGRPDRSFGKDGMVTLKVGNGRRTNVIELPGGKLLGAVGVDGGSSTVFRLRRNGHLDRSFGKAGLAQIKP